MEALPCHVGLPVPFAARLLAMMRLQAPCSCRHPPCAGSRLAPPAAAAGYALWRSWAAPKGIFGLRRLPPHLYRALHGRSSHA